MVIAIRHGQTNSMGRADQAATTKRDDVAPRPAMSPRQKPDLDSVVGRIMDERESLLRELAKQRVVGEILFLDVEDVLKIHSRQIERFGGADGLRDENGLEAAVMRPQMKANYEPETSVHALAASLAYGLARNHAFVDDNKRTSYVAMEAFLVINGWALGETNEVLLETWLALASGHMSEEALAAFLSPRLRALPD